MGAKACVVGITWCSTNNIIDGANAFGVTGYFAESTFEDKRNQEHCAHQEPGQIRDGVRHHQRECTENGDGLRIRLYNVFGFRLRNTLRYNRFEKIGYNGVDVFGPDTTLERISSPNPAIPKRTAVACGCLEAITPGGDCRLQCPPARQHHRGYSGKRRRAATPRALLLHGALH